MLTARCVRRRRGWPRCGESCGAPSTSASSAATSARRCSASGRAACSVPPSGAGCNSGCGTRACGRPSSSTSQRSSTASTSGDCAGSSERRASAARALSPKTTRPRAIGARARAGSGNPRGARRRGARAGPLGRSRCRASRRSRGRFYSGTSSGPSSAATAATSSSRPRTTPSPARASRGREIGHRTRGIACEGARERAPVAGVVFESHSRPDAACLSSRCVSPPLQVPPRRVPRGVPGVVPRPHAQVQ